MRTYVIMGKPTPLSRPRFSMYTKKVFDPQKEFKTLATIALTSQHNNDPLLIGPLHLDVTFYMPIPLRRSTKKYPIEGSPHHIKPDLDNIIKFLCDVANNVIYQDDASIASITSKKVYDLIPRTEFTIKRIE